MSDHEPSHAQSSPAPESTENHAALDDDDFDFKPKGPIRRNAGLLLAVLAVLVIGPAISRYIGSYRAIVLQVRDGEMMVAQLKKPPYWLSGVEGVQPGQMIEKVAGSWSPQAASSTDADAELVDMYARWIDTYEGHISEIIPPAAPGGASVAIIETDDGRKLDLPLWAEHLAASRVGRRVAKKAGTWDPVLLPATAGSAPPDSGTPPPTEAPEPPSEAPAPPEAAAPQK